MSQKARKPRRTRKRSDAQVSYTPIETNPLLVAFTDLQPVGAFSTSRIAMDHAITEALEARTLMSTVSLTNGVLSIDAAGDARLKTFVSYNQAADKIRVIATGGETRRQSFPRVEVREINVIGSNGDDRVRLAKDVEVPASIQAGEGNDRIVGGAGDDVIDAGLGDDKVFGGRGDDIVAGAAGNDKLLGGDGNDELRGGEGNDRLAGNEDNDTLLGGAGNDRLAGNEGNDNLTGGDGRDRFSGGHGNNTLVDNTAEDRGGRSQGPVIGDGNDDTDNPSGNNGGGQNNGGQNGGDDEEPETPTPDDTTPDDQTDDPDDIPNNNSNNGNNGGNNNGSNSNGGNTNNGGSTTTPGADNSADWGGAFDASQAKNAAPNAVLRFVAGSQSGPAGHTVNVNANSSQFFNGDFIGAKFEWDFGDPGTKYNKLIGWNAAHTYDKPGTYTVKLKVTDIGGKSTTVTSTVLITPDTRRSIFVDAKSGNDNNDGSSEAKAVRTLAQASKLAGDNTRILLKKGQVFEVSDSIRIAGRNVIVDAYGPGGNAPTVKKIAGLGSSIFYIAPTATGFVAQNLWLDSMWNFASIYGKKKIPADGFTVTADNFTVRNSAFFNINTGVQTETGPTGVLVQRNYFSHGIRSYGIWSHGYDHAYLGNTMVNSQVEHLIRADGSDGKGVIRVLIHDNDLSRTVANGKGTIELRTASWFYVSNNRIKGGTLRAGLQAIDQKQFPNWAAAKTEYGVIENNVTEKVYINIRPGTDHLAIRNNVVNIDDFFALQLECIEAGYDHVRKTEDVRIERNTVISMGSTGKFLRVHGKATGIVVKNNLYVAPHLDLDGSGRTAAMSISAASDLSGFTEISGNIWPDIDGTSKQDGLHYIGPDLPTRTGYKDADAWEALPQVKNDAYRNVTLGNGYQVRVGAVTAGSSIAKAA